MFAVFSQCACIYWEALEQNTIANSVIWMRENCVVCLSLELQQTECTQTLCYLDHVHILIIHGLIQSYCTPLGHTSVCKSVYLK